MAILGLTHDEKGTALEQLPVTIKVAIGEGPEPGKENSHPRRLDHFVFKRKTLQGQDVVWVPASDIAQAHGEKPTELGIIFLNDEPREVFRTEYALWTTSVCKCHGELVQIANGGGPRYEMRATRRTQKHPEGEAWPGSYKYTVGGPLLHLGEVPDLRRHLSASHEQLPVDSESLERLDADSQAERWTADGNQSHLEGQP